MTKKQQRRPKKAATKTHRPVRVVVRAVRMLDVLSSTGSGVGISDIARETQMSKSTVHHILQTLVASGLAMLDPETRLYQLGPKPIDWARTYSESTDIGAAARPYLRRLREETQETVAVFVRVGAQRVCVARVQSDHAIRHVEHVGEIHPLWQSAPGRVLMSGMADDAIETFLRTADLKPATQYTLVDPKKIMAAIREIRRTGFALAEQEIFLGAAVVAVPIRNDTGGVAGALSVSGPFDRWNKDSAAAHLPRILSSAAELSNRLGFRNRAA